ncbi:glycoside hydrolase superfamily, partial [Zopfochytrium polystomum]
MTGINLTLLVLILSWAHAAWGYCTTRTVPSGAGCWQLTQDCGIPQAQLEQFNSYDSAFCSHLVSGQTYCCTSGGLPPTGPSPSANGTCALCYTYTVQSGDTCDALDRKYNLKTEQIESFNTLTFGWLGCNRLQAGAVICLSTGSAPLPPVDPAAECGLQSMVNGKRNGTCVLNTCCSKWGFCGTTADFCGTGCQSNCGMGYPQSATSPPAHSQYRVGYYATWTRGNACTASSLLQYNLTGYTHIILAFATITSDYKIAFDASAQAALSELAKLSGVKRMVSIGGWGFTDDPATQPIFSRMVANGRSVFIQSLVAMLNAGTVDGFDLDWEYPTASDRGGNAQDIPNYLQLFSDIRKAMPNAPISVTAPASLWYLRGFDIKAISSYVDFINYMTYDFHGQWDYANKWTGPFLRSHVNWTETVDALSLIVRAGVPSNKVTLGIAHYTRSFRMSSTGCTLPGCTFSSQVADAGTCTGTGGIWTQPEIDEYVRLYGEHFNRYFDAQSRSTIGTYGNQWGAYLTEDEKQYRRQQAAAMNLAGTMEWAIDM